MLNNCNCAHLFFLQDCRLNSDAITSTRLMPLLKSLKTRVSLRIDRIPILITSHTGVLSMWRGATPTVLRAMILNACQLATYSKAKLMLMNTGFFSDGIVLHFCASLCSGFLSTVVSMPVDITKTRIQTMKIVDGVPEYKGKLTSPHPTLFTFK